MGEKIEQKVKPLDKKLRHPQGNPSAFLSMARPQHFLKFKADKNKTKRFTITPSPNFSVILNERVSKRQCDRRHSACAARTVKMADVIFARESKKIFIESKSEFHLNK